VRYPNFSSKIQTTERREEGGFKNTYKTERKFWAGNFAILTTTIFSDRLTFVLGNIMSIRFAVFRIIATFASAEQETVLHSYRT
jgi:hypothetical protein